MLNCESSESSYLPSKPNDIILTSNDVICVVILTLILQIFFMSRYDVFFWHCVTMLKLHHNIISCWCYVIMLKLHHSMVSFWCFSMINNARAYNKYLPGIAFSALSVLLLMMVLPLLRNTCNGNLWKFDVRSYLHYCDLRRIRTPYQ